jgi:hypothetical protein
LEQEVTHDQLLASTLFAARQHPTPRLHSCGLPAQGYSVGDKGFAGARPRQRWKEHQQAATVTPPHQTSKRERWPKALRRWLASIRHIIETVNEKLLNTFRLARERPHEPLGLSSAVGGQGRFAQFLYLVQSASRQGSFSQGSTCSLGNWRSYFTPNV